MAYSQVPDSQTFATQVPRNKLAQELQATRTVTVDKPLVLSKGSVAATGSDATDAAAVPDYPFVEVTAADATKGVILTAGGAGKQIVLHNTANAVLKVYPPTGGDFNDGSANAAISLAAKTGAILTCVDGVTWSAIYTA